MGYIIKLDRNHKDIGMLASCDHHCLLGLDPRGIPIIERITSASNSILFELEQHGYQTSLLRLKSSELYLYPNCLQKIEGDLYFSKYLKIFWCDTCIEIFNVSETAFLMAKLQRSDLFNSKALFYLECKKIELRVPIFAGTILSLGSNIMDTITISDKLIKSRHAEIKLSKSDLFPRVSAILGEVSFNTENKDQNNRAQSFQLLPSMLEFNLKSAELI